MQTTVSVSVSQWTLEDTLRYDTCSGQQFILNSEEVPSVAIFYQTEAIKSLITKFAFSTWKAEGWDPNYGWRIGIIPTPWWWSSNPREQKKKAVWAMWWQKGSEQVFSRTTAQKWSYLPPPPHTGLLGSELNWEQSLNITTLLISYL